MSDQLTTLAEIAAAFGFSESTLVRRMREKGWDGKRLIRTIKTGVDRRSMSGKRRYLSASRSEIERWRERQT